MSRPLDLVVIAALVACQADGGELQARRPNVVNTGAAYRGPLSDTDILTLVAELNGSEITGARAALPKLSDPSAMAFAQQLAADHVAMNAALDSLPVTRDTASTPPAQFTTLRVAAGVRSQLVNTMPAGPAYDRAWATLQVNAHGDALDSLRVWQAVAKDAAERDALGTAMTRVSSHLERARALQSALGSGARGGDTLPRAALPPSEKNPIRPAVAQPQPGEKKPASKDTAQKG